MDKIKIGYREYKVIYLEPRRVLYDGGTECIGQIEYDDGMIYLSTKFTEDTRKEALIHEIMHGIDEMYNIGLTEKQVDGLGKGIYTVLKDNGFIK